MLLTTLAFGAGLLAAAGVYGLIIGTLVTDYEWWPPGDKTVPYYIHWTLVAIFNIALIATAVLDWGRWGLVSPVGVAVGSSLAIVGTVVFVWAGQTMRSAETMGVTGDLYTDGPYAYSRNPQYLGMIIGVTGFAFVTDSVLVVILAAVHLGWVLLLPRAEEPHLRAEFGDSYEQYAARVPRFVGLRSVREAFDQSMPK